MIKANNITIKYTKTLFEKINFMLGNKEKVGLVGLNGTGKSTLLKIISGEEKPDSGAIEITPNEHIEYLPQEFDFPQNTFVGEYLEALVDDPVSEMYKVDRILADLHIKNIDHFVYLDVLSPGQKMKLYLTKLLMQQPTILLLDEPTNHLDIDGIVWFENFVKKFNGIVIMVSHDRAFLNSTTNRIFEIDEQTLRVWVGNYDDYLEQKYEYTLERAKLFQLQERKREQMDKLLANARKIKDGKRRGKAVEAAKKRMEREVTRNEISDYTERKIGNISIAGEVHKTKKILEVKGLKFSYQNSSSSHFELGSEYILKHPAYRQAGVQDDILNKKNLLEDINLEIYGGEKLWILGSNGIGKSTLIKLLIGKLQGATGEIKWGENIKWDYFSQNQEHLPLDSTVSQYIFEQTNVSWDQSFGFMQKFLFDREQRDQKIERLSPGQRARLSFIVFAQHNYDCLILDEPTNHLDIKTKEVIENALREFKGAIILISHDRYFAESINPDRIITIEKGVIKQLEI